MRHEQEEDGSIFEDRKMGFGFLFFSFGIWDWQPRGKGKTDLTEFSIFPRIHSSFPDESPDLRKITKDRHFLPVGSPAEKEKQNKRYLGGLGNPRTWVKKKEGKDSLECVPGSLFIFLSWVRCMCVLRFHHYFNR